jgi:hypothetical protein
MLHWCTKHGEVPIPYCVSQSIFDYVENSTYLATQIHCVYIICPDYLNKIHLFYLDEDDFSLVSDYVETFSDNNRRNTLISILGSIKGSEIADNHLFLMDREKDKMNDRIFLKKIEHRMKAICPECLQASVAGVVVP